MSISYDAEKANAASASKIADEENGETAPSSASEEKDGKYWIIFN